VESPSLTRHRKTFFAPIWLFGLLALVALLASIAALIYYRSATTTTIVLVRHAEKELGSIADAPLTAFGEQRAERLAAMFGDRERFGRLRAIYVTSKRRSQQTAAPLARRLGIAPVVSDESVATLASRILAEQRGAEVLVIGHSNTVPDLVAALTGKQGVPPIDEAQEYGTMYVVSVPALGAASVLRMKY
jgi:broad specificity phosphatase PhoE